MFNARYVIGIVLSAILTMLIIWMLKKTNVPFVSAVAREV